MGDQPIRAQLRMRWRALGIGAVTLVSAAVMCLGALVLHQRDVDQRMRENVEQSYILRTDMLRVFSLTQDVETGTRGFVITGNDVFLQPYENARRKLPVELARLRRGAASDHEQSYSARLDQLVREKLDISAQIIVLRRENRPGSAALLIGTGHGKEIMDAMRGVVAEWEDRERWQMAQRTAAADRSHRALTAALAALSAAVVALLAFMAFAAGMVLRATTRAAAELAESRDDAEAASRAKSAFLTMMSHELRTPLNGVLGMAHVLSLTDLDARQRSHLEIIGSSGRSLLLILNDILDLSKIEAGKLEVETVPFALVELLESVAALWAAPAAEKGLKLNLHLDGDIPDWATGDPTRLRQVITNLLSNAVKFTDQGAIWLRANASRDGQLIFEVADTGAGIPRDVQTRLFSDFSQADASTSRKFGGTGLGLSISRKLCRLMGGDLTVTSPAGEGATFRGSIRIGVADARAPDAAPALAEMPMLQVLAVDDNPANRAVAEALLSALGMSVTLACDGAEALDVLRTQPLDLVFMDINMPVMGGVEALQAIRRGEAGDAGVMIVALTANAMVGDRERYIALGFDDHLAKPIQPAALVQALAVAAARQTAARPDRAWASKTG
jgi:signal transduction histidine kinase/CheY-like chemotaxis protein